MPSDRHRNRVKGRQINQFIRKLNFGIFEGYFNLQWVAPDWFQYTPNPDNPFCFYRRNGKGESYECITPGPMLTNGGSIPKFAQALPGLSAWEYGPAYIIHDWEFNLGRHGQKSFEDVNWTLAEGVWTLMCVGYLDFEKPEENRSNVELIYKAVSSTFGRKVWDSAKPTG